MILPRNSSKYGTVQPPSVKLPLVSSVGPPGPCITPSRLRKVRTIIFLIRVILPEATIVKGPFRSPFTACWRTPEPQPIGNNRDCHFISPRNSVFSCSVQSIEFNMNSHYNDHRQFYAEIVMSL